ncbi:SDR family oxidoreductase [Nocardioides sp. CER19]|uniref:SDR family oxidoreductase n=1 Tax=Nocardioides sp. CER19 TaxID=3038538 RepID=UPI00244971B7|nr:SDR family oxidoreductase [Nocardioides sp. CER19]MDH2415348.1 SDR family oxidoreductase [Nocardioides sp. CER19]
MTPTGSVRRRHLLTGAGSGIGRELARRLSRRGDELWLVVRDPAKVTEEFPDARLIVADLADSTAIAGLDLPDRLDSLVHAAGVVELGAVAELDEAAWTDQLAVNLVAPALLTRAALPALRAARGTAIFVNSGSGLRANPGWAAYAASKFGLRALADALRLEERDHGVRVTSVFPGRTATPMQEKVHRQEGKDYDESHWIRPETVVDALVSVIDLPADATIPEVQVSPR